MTKRLFLVVLIIGTWINSFAQKIDSDIISSAGLTFTTTDYTLNFSIGEISTATLSIQDRILTQGFIQPATETILSTNSTHNHSQILIYPNPVEDQLHLAGMEDEKLIIRITDTLGKTIDEKETLEKTFDFSSLPTGVYFIFIEEMESRNHQVFKVLKK